MTPVKFPLKFRRGADWHRVFTHRDPKTGVPHDLAGCTARMQVREEIGSPVILDELTTENGRLLIVDRLVDRLNPLNGNVLAGLKMVFPSAITANAAWSKGVFDLEIVRSSGWVDCMIEQSTITLTGEVTRP